MSSSWKRFALPTLAVAMIGLYALLALRFPLLPNYNKVPTSDVRTFAPSLSDGIGYAVLLLAAYVLYLLAYRFATTLRANVASLFVATGLFAIPLLLTYPINATDVFRYYVRARVGTVHGASPLETPPEAFPDDPYLPLAGEWAANTSPYGPVWEMSAAAITDVSGSSLLGATILFKVAALLFHLGIGLVLWRTLWPHPPAMRNARLLLWLWNPALLLVFVVDAHNDALMLFWLVLGYWLIARKRRAGLGFVVMALGALTKPIGLLPLPFFFVDVWRQLPGRRARLRFMAMAALGTLALTVLAFLPFGSPIDLALRLVFEASDAAGFSPGVTVLLVANRFAVNLPVATVSSVGLVVFLAFSGWLLWRTYQHRSAIRAAADVFVGYIATAITFRIWYAAWPFPWLVLDSSLPRLYAGLTFLLTAQVSVVIYGHIRAELLQGDQTAAHLIGVPFTFGIPLLVGLLFARIHGRQSGKALWQEA